MQSVLIIDDALTVHKVIEVRLRSEKLLLHHAYNAEEGLALLRRHRPDLVLLDLDMPDTNGMDVCRQIRADPALVATPVIFLTGTIDVSVKVQAFDLGAIDYVTKPFHPEELLARVEALSRRPRKLSSPLLKVADLELSQDTREVRRGGPAIELTPKEYTVLEYLMRHAGRVMSRTLITEYAWGYHFDPGTNIVDVVINHLRKKIDARHDKKLITTVRGVGYVVKG